MKLVKSAAAASAGLGLAVAGSMPAGAGVTEGPWSNNGCSYWGYNDATPNGTTWGTDGCDAGWVEVVYKDSKGNTQREELWNQWYVGGNASVYNNVNGTQLLFTCHAARSRSHGNWSLERKIGSAAGSCSQAP